MKPSDFFVGVIDFLAVILPGAVGAFLLRALVPSWPSVPQYPQATEVTWIMIAFVSYLFGQLVFLIGSALDAVYDLRRERLKPAEHDKTFLAAVKVRARLSPELEGAQLTTFKWTKAFLLLHAPAARAEVDQLEASSKFFRSLTVLFALAAGALFVAVKPAYAVVAAALSYACFRGFFDHRWKCTELAYAYTVLATGELSKPPRA